MIDTLSGLGAAPLLCLGIAVLVLTTGAVGLAYWSVASARPSDRSRVAAAAAQELRRLVQVLLRATREPPP